MGRSLVVAGDATALPVASASVDAIVTDPPYGLDFMGKAWDRLGTPKEFQEWCGVWAAEALRVLKPGGWILSFGGTRTYHRMTCGLEDAGFEIRDCLFWLYGTGFPKSLNVSKAIDKHLGATREKVRVDSSVVRNPKSIQGGHGVEGGDRPWMREAMEKGYHEVDGEEAATEEAAEWDGWGTALKPAVEPIVLARKPLIGTVAANVLEHGTGGLNVGGCRITGDLDGYWPGDAEKTTPSAPGYEGGFAGNTARKNEGGRWPANVVLDPEAAAMLDEQSGTLTSGAWSGKRNTDKFGRCYGNFHGNEAAEYPRESTSGGASRFFYVAKPTAAERTCEGDVENDHVTVKPVALMRYLCRLVTPPGGLVLDPFLGSGTTGMAALMEGLRFVGVELSPHHAQTAQKRIAWTKEGVKAEEQCLTRKEAREGQKGLFG